MKHRTNLNQFPELSNSQMETINITFHRLTIKGLHIRYEQDDHKRLLFLNPSQTCELLEELSYIKGYYTFEGEPVIINETLNVYPGTDGEPVEEPIDEEESWKEFVKRFQFELTDLIAHYIVTYLEESKKLEKWAQNMRSIPNLIHSIKQSA